MVIVIINTIKIDRIICLKTPNNIIRRVINKM